MLACRGCRQGPCMLAARGRAEHRRVLASSMAGVASRPPCPPTHPPALSPPTHPPTSTPPAPAPTCRAPHQSLPRLVAVASWALRRTASSRIDELAAAAVSVKRRARRERPLSLSIRKQVRCRAMVASWHDVRSSQRASLGRRLSSHQMWHEGITLLLMLLMLLMLMLRRLRLPPQHRVQWGWRL